MLNIKILYVPNNVMLTNTSNVLVKFLSTMKALHFYDKLKINFTKKKYFKFYPKDIKKSLCL